MLDKYYIFDASIKLLKEAAYQLDNNEVLKEIEDNEKEYNVSDVDTSLPFISSCLLFSEGLLDTDNVYDIVAKEVRDNKDAFNKIYNNHGVILIDSKNYNMRNSLDNLNYDEYPEFDFALRSLLFDYLLNDTMEKFRKKGFASSYLYDMLDSEIMDDYEKIDDLRVFDPEYKFTDQELELIDKITFYRASITLDNCKDKDYFNYIEKVLNDYDRNDVYKSNSYILDNNGEIDLPKLIKSIRNALAHNNYEELNEETIKIYHEENGKLTCNYVIEKDLLCHLVFKLMDCIDKSLINIKKVLDLDLSVKKDIYLWHIPNKGESIDYLKQYRSLTNKEMEEIYNTVKSMNISDPLTYLKELDKLARPKLQDRLSDTQIKNYLKRFNCLSNYDIERIMLECRLDHNYNNYKVNRDSNDPYHDQLHFVNTLLQTKYNYIHSYPNVMEKLLYKHVSFEDYELNEFEVLDGVDNDYSESISKLCINSVLSMMFVNNDQNKEKKYIFKDLLNNIYLPEYTINKFNNNTETKDFIASRTKEIDKCNNKIIELNKNLSKIPSSNTKGINSINNSIKSTNDRINSINEEVTKFKTEYITRHLRNAIAHGNVSYKCIQANDKATYLISLYDFNEDGSLEFYANTTLESVVSLLFSESYTKEVLNINKKGNVKVKK